MTKTNENPIHTHSMCLNSDRNGGGNIWITTTWSGSCSGIVGPDQGYYSSQQKLVITSLGVDSIIDFTHCEFTPSKLRKLADEIEKAERIASEKFKDIKEKYGNNLSEAFSCGPDCE